MKYTKPDASRKIGVLRIIVNRMQNDTVTPYFDELINAICELDHILVNLSVDDIYIYEDLSNNPDKYISFFKKFLEQKQLHLDNWPKQCFTVHPSKTYLEREEELQDIRAKIQSMTE